MTPKYNDKTQIPMLRDEGISEGSESREQRLRRKMYERIARGGAIADAEVQAERDWKGR